MLHKNKHHYDHHHNQSKNQTSMDVKIKAKKHKECHHKSTKADKDANPSIKSKLHGPSKSALSNLQHIHYNSPTVHACQLPQNKPTNPFTFTQLLQQSDRNHNNFYSSSTVRESLYGHYQNNDKQNKNTDKSSARTPNTNTNFIPNIPSTYKDTDRISQQMQFSRVLRQKVCNLRNDNSISQQKSMGKSTSKSPLKVTNVHRLTNTPKIKEHKSKTKDKKSQKQSIKTFTEVLTSQQQKLDKKIKINEEQIINLQCSQKLYKYIRQSQQKKKCVKNKSNLLSTGILNFSQPIDHSQSAVNRLSKQTVPSKNYLDRVINEQHIKQFSDDSQLGLNQASFPFRIKEVKDKIQQLNEQIRNSVHSYTESTFMDKINQSFNPELVTKDVTKVIQQLSLINNLYQNSFQNMIKTISITSQKLYQDISTYIDLLNTSKSTTINWIEVENQLHQQDAIESALCKNQILNAKISELEQSFLCSNQNEKSAQPFQYLQKNILQIQCQLSKSINNISSIISKDHNHKQKQPQDQILEHLKNKYSLLQSYKQSFCQLFTP